MTIVWCIFTEVYLRPQMRNDEEKKAQTRYLPIWCCGLTSTILSFLIFILRLWGLWLFRFQCFRQLSGVFKISFMYTTTGKKNYREKYIIQPHWRKKKKKKNFSVGFSIRQHYLLISGNVLNSYPRGACYTMMHIHARSSITSRSPLLPVTHNSWSKLNCQKITARQWLLFSAVLIIMMNYPMCVPRGTL